jgi:hypothetical protein
MSNSPVKTAATSRPQHLMIDKILTDDVILRPSQSKEELEDLPSAQLRQMVVSSSPHRLSACNFVSKNPTFLSGAFAPSQRVKQQLLEI